jgi:hypothetical protein
MIVMSRCTGLAEFGMMPPVKYCEIIADKLIAVGSAWEYCNAGTSDGGRWIVAAHKNGQRHVVQCDELLTAFPELEATLL